MVQLKNKLQFGPDSKYNPICLPQCDSLCRTRGGLTIAEMQADMSAMCDDVRNPEYKQYLER